MCVVLLFDLLLVLMILLHTQLNGCVGQVLVFSFTPIKAKLIEG